MLTFGSAVLVIIAVASALPTDPVVMRLVPDGRRFQYVESDEDGSLHVVDTWVKVSDLVRNARFNADTQTRFHLFTRRNPNNSQVIVMNNAASVQNSNFNRARRTAILIHGWLGSATAGSNRALVPAYLAGEDVNVIVVDWSAGSNWGPNGFAVGRTTGRFINWLNSVTGSNVNQYHIIGFSVGGHAAGIVGRNTNGRIAHITGLDPSVRWEANQEFRPADGAYTEVIHTSAGVNGWLAPLAQVDFYPNGGSQMPGCGLNIVCDHERSYYYMAESLRTGGFTGSRCNTHHDAFLGNCPHGPALRMGGRLPKPGSYYYMAESLRTGGFTGSRCNTHHDAFLGNCPHGPALRMGGRLPKPGNRGVYFVRTNNRSPFSIR